MAAFYRYNQSTVSLTVIQTIVVDEIKLIIGENATLSLENTQIWKRVVSL